MDVQCEKCGTEYALDETLVGPSGTAVRCTSCGHVFKVFPRAEASPVRETWMLRQASGATFPFDRLGVLQDWISAGKVSEDDLIAKSGGEWKRLGDIAEMRPFFDASKATKQSMPAPGAPAAGYPGTLPSEHAATIRAPAGGITPSTPGAPAADGPSTAEFGLPRVSETAPTQQGVPVARPSGPATVGHAQTMPAESPTMQAQAPTIQMPGQAPSTVQPGAPTVQAHVPGVDPQTAPTQPRLGSDAAAMAPTRPLKPVPESEPPAAAVPVDPVADQRTLMSEPNFSESQIPADTDEGRWEQGAGVHAGPSTPRACPPPTTTSPTTGPSPAARWASGSRSSSWC
jgi:predicted Zn finger-like uncharacterized protein